MCSNKSSVAIKFGIIDFFKFYLFATVAIAKTKSYLLGLSKIGAHSNLYFKNGLIFFVNIK